MTDTRNPLCCATASRPNRWSTAFSAGSDICGCRVTATGQLYPCLGGGEQVDLRAALRSGDQQANLTAALDEALRITPDIHHFRLDQCGADPALPRHMSMTGG